LSLLLVTLLCVELVARVVLEIRECRAVQCRFSAFTVMRILPLVNDLAPLPENREQPTVGKFVEMHEQAHAKLHHAILRNLVKVAFALCAIWFMAALMVRWECSIVESVLWLHLAAIPFRTFFHFYCWNQEYECDRYALEKTDRKIAKNALQELARCEYPHTVLFSLIYREHPTVALRSKRILNKPIVNTATK
jgi:hypothetical protein